jgi:hypothetical protein
MTADLIYNKLADHFTSGNIRKLEQLLGFTNGAIGKAIARKSIIRPETQALILHTFPTINKYWLQTGEGEMFSKKLEKSKEDGTTLDNNDKTRNDMYINSTTYHLPAQVIYDTVNNMIKNKEITVARLSEETRIPQQRMYKWFSDNSVSKPVKAQDLETLQAFLQKHNAIKQLSFPNESKQPELFPTPVTKSDPIPASKYIAMLEQHYEDMKATKNDLQHTKDELLHQQTNSIAAINTLSERNSLFENTLGAIKDILAELKSFRASSDESLGLLQNVGTTLIENQRRHMKKDGVNPFPYPEGEALDVADPASLKVASTSDSK